MEMVECGFSFVVAFYAPTCGVSALRKDRIDPLSPMGGGGDG